MARPILLSRPRLKEFSTQPATWIASATHVADAIQRLGNSALEAEIRAALAARRVAVETTLVEVMPNGVRFTPL